MTEPMKTPKRLLYEKAELNFIGEQLIIQLMEEYAAQQVAAERERIKKYLSAETIKKEWDADMGNTVILTSDLFKLIDSL